ncbi:hypothetical protein BM1_08822 [Bipolaris maydis]|nr:hypothetical protein BM1_08822 [Bipolaris maydis]
MPSAVEYNAFNNSSTFQTIQLTYLSFNMRLSVAFLFATLTAFVAASPSLQSRANCDNVCNYDGLCCGCPGGSGCYSCSEGSDAGCFGPN